ncbi:MAG TPA: efflux RND transporter periplasmic adaptor subunit [Terriglobia bacterium]|nr:efflux RND transporter periplasmic adaptor subunit [Terriglobia bacterium]
MALSLVLSGCGKVRGESDANNDTGPHPATVEPDINADNFKLDHPERFSLTTAGEYMATPELNVTGVVSPDVSRQVPVPSLASGRVLEINARLGDEVKKGQLLFKVRSTDIAGAFSDYQKALKNEQQAVNNQRLTRIQLERAQLLYEKGATSKSALEIAINVEEGGKTALENARVDIATTRERLEHLGVADFDHPSGIVNVFAPVSGVITDQQITDSSGVQALTPPNPFTISDLSHVWIVCDVYENDIAKLHLGEYADIRLNAYPDRLFKARISNILPTLDPNLRTTKVRLEVENPGLLRFGMFVTATFHGQQEQRRASVPATAILHLHDREWVYVPADSGGFRRVEVVAGNMLPNNMQEIISGIKAGDQVVANALVLQDTVEK